MKYLFVVLAFVAGFYVSRIMSDRTYFISIPVDYQMEVICNYLDGPSIAEVDYKFDVVTVSCVKPLNLYIPLVIGE